MRMPDSLKAVLDRIYVELEHAFQHKDWDTVASYTAAEFVAHTPDGDMKSKQQLIDGLKERFAKMDVVAWPRRVVSLRKQGHRIHATTVGAFRTRLPDGTINEIELSNEDTWMFRNDEWLIVASRPTPIYAPGKKETLR